MKCGDCSSGYVNDGAKGCKGLCLGVDEWVCWGACSSLFSLNNIAVISFRHAMPFSIVVVKHSRPGTITVSCPFSRTWSK